MMLEAFVAAAGRSFRRHWMAWLLGSLLAFLVFPGLDLTVSGWFWEAQGGWVYKDGFLLEFVRKGLPTVIVGGVLFMLLLYVAGLIFKQRFLGIDGWISLYVVLTLAVGPGVIVNGVFKDNWGRARPSQIIEFGGAATYTPPFMVAGQCDTNCSFVSGHGALGFWLVTLAFLVPAPWRGRAILGALVCGGLVAVVRIMQGGHFLSDTLYSATITILVSWAMWKAMFGGRETPHGTKDFS